MSTQLYTNSKDIQAKWIKKDSVSWNHTRFLLGWASELVAFDDRSHVLIRSLSFNSLSIVNSH